MTPRLTAVAAAEDGTLRQDGTARDAHAGGHGAAFEVDRVEVVVPSAFFVDFARDFVGGRGSRTGAGAGAIGGDGGGGAGPDVRRRGFDVLNAGLREGVLCVSPIGVLAHCNGALSRVALRWGGVVAVVEGMPEVEAGGVALDVLAEGFRGGGLSCRGGGVAHCFVLEDIF